MSADPAAADYSYAEFMSGVSVSKAPTQTGSVSLQQHLDTVAAMRKPWKLILIIGAVLAAVYFFFVRE